jgi:general L-amino acid transport system permease protein
VTKHTTSDNDEGFRLGRLLTDERSRGIVIQVAVLLAVALFIAFITFNTITNLKSAGLATGFGFLDDPAFFDINQPLIEYNSQSSFARALLVGFLNTVMVSVLGIIAATIIGVIAGVLRLSSNWLISRLVTSYVEFVRNVPVLLQIIFWWALLTGLPKVRDSLSLGDTAFLNNRGVRVPAPLTEPGFGWVLAALAAGIVIAILITRWARKRQDLTGQIFPTGWTTIGLIIGLPLIVYFALGQPLGWDIPRRTRFNFQGGINITPELIALWLALATYTGAFIAEIVRAGILSVSRGQSEAAFALGLRPNLTMQKIILPQALRVIIPPLTSQYLNLTKNSSLAIVIGYQDLVSIGGSILNQSGHSLEIVAIWMAVYLSLSLATSAYMNWYNKRISLVER